MAEKRIIGRAVQKHDVEKNWQKATGFIPMVGEVIVYDRDDNVTDESLKGTYSYARFKIGDGVQNVNALPFVDGALRAEFLEQINSVDDKVDAVSTLVGDKSVSEQIEEAVDAIPQADWGQNDKTAADYVKGRTHWVGDSVEEELVNVTVTTESYFSKDMGATLDIVVGKEYTVIHNGEIYNLIGENDVRGYGAYLGNGYILSSDNVENDTPFVIQSYYSDFSLSIRAPKSVTETVERHIIITTVNTEIHKLDPLFIPDEIIIGSPGTGLKSVILNDTSTNVADGEYSYAGGVNTNASGYCAHAQNSNTVASGAYSTAIGSNTKATENNSFSSGFYTEATGKYSRAGGNGAKSSGEGATSEGRYTLASSRYQHVQGQFNIEDVDNRYAHIVGNGERASSRSNAHTLDWDGNAWFAGDVYVGGTGQDDTAAKTLATTEYVDTTISNIPTPDVSGQIEAHNISETAHNDIRTAVSDLSALVGDTSVSEQISTAIDEIPVADNYNDGLMLSDDKEKLDAIESGAQKNVQSDWAQNDMSSMEFVQNRPFYDGPISITWDGVTKGHPAHVYDSSNYLIKITDTIFTDEELQAAKFVISENGTTTEVVVADVWENRATTSALTGILYNSRPCVYVVHEAGTFVGPGTYFLYNYSSKIYIQSLTVGSDTDVKKIDEKYIPDTIARTSGTYSQSEVDAMIAAVREACMPKFTTVTIAADEWNYDNQGDYYDVVLSCLTSNSKVDLQADSSCLSILQDDGIALAPICYSSFVRIVAVGGAPREDITVQMTIQQVAEV